MSEYEAAAIRKRRDHERHLKLCRQLNPTLTDESPEIAPVITAIEKDSRLGLDSLTEKIRLLMRNLDKLVGQEDGRVSSEQEAPRSYFVKLSMRSAKDSALEGAAMKKELRRHMSVGSEFIGEEKKSRAGNDNDEDEDSWEQRALIAFIRASSTAMVVHTPEDAVSSFLASQRIYDDLVRISLFFASTPEASGFDVQIVVRAWKEIDPSLEFRCFSVEGKLTAATQYYQWPYLQEVVAREQHVKDMLYEYHKSILPQLDSRMQAGAFSLDVVFSTHLDSLQIIEVGHGPPTAGTSLFSWDDDVDRQILRNGPFELRVKKQPLAHPLEFIHPPLRLYLYLLREEYWGNLTRKQVERISPRYRCNCCHVVIFGPRFHDSAKNVDACYLCFKYGICHENRPCFEGLYSFVETMPGEQNTALISRDDLSKNAGRGCICM